MIDSTLFALPVVLETRTDPPPFDMSTPLLYVDGLSGWVSEEAPRATFEQGLSVSGPYERPPGLIEIPLSTGQSRLSGKATAGETAGISICHQNGRRPSESQGALRANVARIETEPAAGSAKSEPMDDPSETIDCICGVSATPPMACLESYRGKSRPVEPTQPVDTPTAIRKTSGDRSLPEVP
jgi:hypothetical protein